MRTLLSALVLWIGLLLLVVYAALGHIFVLPAALGGLALVPVGSLLGLYAIVEDVLCGRTSLLGFLGQVLFAAAWVALLAALVLPMEPFRAGVFRGNNGVQLCLADDGRYVQSGMPSLPRRGRWDQDDGHDNNLEIGVQRGCQTWSWTGRVGLHLHDDARTSLRRVGDCDLVPDRRESDRLLAAPSGPHASIQAGRICRIYLRPGGAHVTTWNHDQPIKSPAAGY